MFYDNVAIRVNNLGKCYQIYSRPQDRLKQSLYSRLQALVDLPNKTFHREFWALKGVSFEIKKGETVGIVGRNGSGKSTLLQIVCGTVSPTKGRVETRGRVAALLELGAGFNPEFTGRENVHLNGAIAGLSGAEITERFADIERFAEIGQFIDQPVKTYSSGMYARLAFAAAIHVKPDVLVVDESLSVGDEAFQRKCFARIRDLKSAGVTVLLVSHSSSTIAEMCDRAILLDQGERLLTGRPKVVIAKYQKLAYAGPDKVESIRCEIRDLDTSLSANPDSVLGVRELEVSRTGSTIVAPVVQSIPVNDRFDPALIPRSTVSYASRGAEIRNVRIIDDQERVVNVLTPGTTYFYTYEVDFRREVHHVHFGMFLKSVSGIELGGMGSHPIGEGIETLNPGQVVRVRFKFRNVLLPGTYFTNAGCLGVIDGEETFLHRIVDAVMFRVEAPETSRTLGGYVNCAAEPACELVIVGSSEPAVKVAGLA